MGRILSAIKVTQQVASPIVSMQANSLITAEHQDLCIDIWRLICSHLYKNRSFEGKLEHLTNIHGSLHSGDDGFAFDDIPLETQ